MTWADHFRACRALVLPERWLFDTKRLGGSSTAGADVLLNIARHERQRGNYSGAANCVHGII